MIRCVLLVLALAPAGCDRVFDLTGRTPEIPVDAAVDAAPPDARLCYGSGSLRLCLDAVPAPIYTVAGGTLTKVDTSSVACMEYVGGEPNLCVIGGMAVTIDGTLQAVGPRPLVIVGTTVALTGTIDVSSRLTESGAGGQPPECVLGTPAGANGGGGFGGTFGGRGGNGGGGNGSMTNGGVSAVISISTRLRGGCQGGFGHLGNAILAGRGGGSVAILADVITINGTINASGAFGYAGTGGMTPGRGASGGGSGGMIVLDSPAIMIAASGRVFANGGGGGEGGGNPNGGNDGQAPTEPATPAPGGSDGSSGGDGGDGAAGNQLDGERGRAGVTTSGGGGGGGGAGVIRMTSTPSNSGTISPPSS